MPGTVGGRRAWTSAVFALVALLVLNLALWLLYRNTRRDLETELGQQLQTIAHVVARTLDEHALAAASLRATGARAQPDSLEAYWLDTHVGQLRDRLREMRRLADLANVTLYDLNGVPFLDVVAIDELALPQAPFDRAELESALAGSTAHTPLYRSRAQFLMTGYAPVVLPLYDWTFAVGVEADATFFVAIEKLRRSLFAVGALSIALLTALGVFFARMQARLAQADAAVQRAETLASMGRMAAGIAHEIRNPLAIIRATATRLKKRYQDPNDPDEKFDFIADEVDRLNTTLTGYLQFARDEAVHLEAVDLVPTVRRTLRLMQPELDAGRVEVALQAPEDLMARADAQRLQQLLMNLVLNSIQAMPQGGRLTIELRADSPYVRLRVSDTGSGIAPALRDRVFDPFYTTKTLGSGLGLTVVRRIVEQHHGSIAIGDAAGGGACIDIRLPEG